MVDAPDTAPDVERLLAFLRGRDVPCPLFRHNLRDLTRPDCPECRQPLVLAVGLRDVRLGWLIAFGLVLMVVLS